MNTEKLKEQINADEGPCIGSPLGNEPGLKSIIEFYYRQAHTPAAAEKLAQDYVDKFVEDLTNEASPPAPGM